MIKNLDKFIIDTYRRVLGRAADIEGLENYKHALTQHMQPCELEKNLRRSEEYLMLYKLIQTGKMSKDRAYIDNNDQIVWIDANEPIKNIATDGHEVTIVSTWDIKCGIATYSKYLRDNINRLNNNFIGIHPINQGVDDNYIDSSALLHLQHEYGIMPNFPRSHCKVIVTFHTVLKESTIPEIEKNLNVAAYVAHFKEAKEIISRYTKKDIWLIPHGSKIIPGANIDIMKDVARQLLSLEDYGITKTDKFAFIFGFQSGDKNYGMLSEACNNTGTKLVISGALHQTGNRAEIENTENVILLDRFLSDIEIDLFALASDMLLFNTIPLKHYSCSGAMHRVVGAGRPVICSRVNHYSDIQENKYCLKYDNQNELELKILEALKRKEELGKKAYEFAQLTSWDAVAKKHLEMYKKYGVSCRENLTANTTMTTISQ